MHHTTSQSNSLDHRTRVNNKQLFIWTSMWLLTTALMAFGPKLMWDFDKTFTLIAAILNLLAGVKMLLVNKAFLNGLDELQRKIHFNAMAISLGVTMISGTLYGLLQPSGLIDFSPNPSNLLFVMGISYLVAIAVNNKVYS